MTLSFKLSGISDAASQVLQQLDQYHVWALHGEMGAGKTTFIHALCEHLEITSAFGSPTYSLINEYNTKRAGVVYHIDCYRLKDEEEAIQAGIEDTLFSGRLCFVEWPEKISPLLPERSLELFLEVIDQDERQLSFDHPADFKSFPTVSS